MIRNTNETTTIADFHVAVILGRPVTIDYENADGIRRVRKVEPFEIVDREHAAKRPFFRAMDRLTGTYRTFRFDRLFAYRVSNARGKYRVPRPAPRRTEEITVFTETSPEISQAGPTGFNPGKVVDDLDAEWADWMELTYDPDAPVPYLPADKEL